MGELSGNVGRLGVVRSGWRSGSHQQSQWNVSADVDAKRQLTTVGSVEHHCVDCRGEEVEK